MVKMKKKTKNARAVVPVRKNLKKKKKIWKIIIKVEFTNTFTQCLFYLNKLMTFDSWILNL